MLTNTTTLCIFLGMACQKTKRRKYRPRPGAVAAALQLGVTYSHLRRVLARERQSRSLLERCRALVANHANAAGAAKRPGANRKP
jgi:thiamine monophosphate synthase